MLHEEPGFSVRTVHLDHKIPCLAFALAEKTHLNVRKDELERLGIPAGPWLNELKDAMRTGQPDDTIINARVAGRRRPARRASSVSASCATAWSSRRPGRSSPTSSTRCSARRTSQRIVELARDADVFFCESLFLDEDRDQALKRHHLTARQAGTLARLAASSASRCSTSRRATTVKPERMYAEAAATFAASCRRMSRCEDRVRARDSCSPSETEAIG